MMKRWETTPRAAEQETGVGTWLAESGTVQLQERL